MPSPRSLPLAVAVLFAAIVCPALASAGLTASPPGGQFAAPVAVTIEGGAPAAELHYTLDGSDPALGSPVVPAHGVVVIDRDAVLKVRAFVAGRETNDALTATYRITGSLFGAPAPFTLPGPGAPTPDHAGGLLPGSPLWSTHPGAPGTGSLGSPDPSRAAPEFAGGVLPLITDPGALAGTASAGSIDDEPPTAGLKLWLRADAGLLDPTVALWPDQSGNGNDLSQTIPESQPRLVPAAVNGRPAVRFDGLDDLLILGGKSIYSQNDGLTCFAVLASDDRSTQLFLDYGRYGERHYGFGYGVDYAGVATAQDHGGHDSLRIGTHSAGRNWSLFTGEIVFSQEQRVRLNGGAPLFRTPITLAQLTPTEVDTNPEAKSGGRPFTLGRQARAKNQAFDPQFQGAIAELLIYDRVLGDAERQNVESYLRVKYALPAPAVTEVNVTASDPEASETGLDPGQFTVTRSGGDLSRPLTIHYETGGSALKNLDYPPLMGWVTIPAGVASAEIKVPIIDDADYEGTLPETVSITLLGDITHNVGPQASATVSIRDNDLVVPVPQGGLQLWLSADRERILDVSGRVVGLADLSGKRNDAYAEGAVEFWPSWIEGVIGGRPVMRFDGRGDYLSLQARRLYSENDGVTCIAVLASREIRRGPVFFDFGASPARHYGFSFDVERAGIGTPTDFGGVNDLQEGRHQSGPGEFVVYTGEIEFGVEQRVRLFGGSPLVRKRISTARLTSAEIAANDLRLQSAGPVTIGRRSIEPDSHNARNLAGDIAEVLFYDRVLTDSEREQVERYLMAKYGIFADTDRDGLSDEEEARLGTDPLVVDTDGDGYSDFEEVTVLLSDPLRADLAPPVTLVDLRGEQIADFTGVWATFQGGISAESTRGSVDYRLEAPAAGVYRLEIEARAERNAGSDPYHELIVSLDGQFLERIRYRLAEGQRGVVHLATPWMSAGAHTLRLFYNNARQGKALSIEAVRLQQVGGEDANANGVPDWIEQRLARLNGLLTTAVTSVTSPFCLEGDSRYQSFLRINAGGAPVPVQPAPGDGWYTDVALAEDGSPTPIQVQFENGALVVEHPVAWAPVNVLTSSDLIIRKGDALRVMAARGADESPRGSVTFRLDDAVLATTEPGTAVVHRFEQAGEFVLGAALEDGAGPISRTMRVRVIEAAFAGSPIALVEQPREWPCPQIPATGVAIESDSRILFADLGPLPDGGRRFRFRLDAPEDRFVLARLDLGGSEVAGPILASARLRGTNVQASADTSVEILKTYEDGSQLIEMSVVADRLMEGMRIGIDIFVGGILFEDGTTYQELTSRHFNELGIAKVRFIRPAGASTSVCHTLRVYDGSVLIGGAY